MDLGKEGTQGAARVFSSQRGFPPGGCSDCLWLLGTAGPLGPPAPSRPSDRHPQRREGAALPGLPSPSRCGRQSRVSRRLAAGVSGRAPSVGAVPTPSARRCPSHLRRPGSAPRAPLSVLPQPLPPNPAPSARPAPPLASILSPSFLPPCGHQGESRATSGPWLPGPPALPPPRWAPGSPAGALRLGGRERLRPERGGRGDSYRPRPPGIFERVQAAPTRPSKRSEDLPGDTLS